MLKSKNRKRQRGRVGRVQRGQRMRVSVGGGGGLGGECGAAETPVGPTVQYMRYSTCAGKRPRLGDGWA